MTKFPDISIARGETADAVFTIKNKETSDFIILTKTPKATVKSNLGGIVKSVDISLENEKVKLSFGDTENFPIGVHVWDIDIELPNGRKITLPRGRKATFEVREDVTRESDSD